MSQPKTRVRDVWMAISVGLFVLWNVRLTAASKRNPAVANGSTYFFSAFTSTAELAHRHCESLEMDPLSPRPEDYVSLAAGLREQINVAEHYWLGLHVYDGDVYRWHNFTLWPDNVEMWAEGQPQPHLQGCATIDSSTLKWTTGDCDQNLRWICQTRPRPSFVDLQRGCPKTCPDCLEFRKILSERCFASSSSPFRVAGNMCYALRSTVLSTPTWKDYQASCRSIYLHPYNDSLSSNLASIHDDFEHTFIVAHLAVFSGWHWFGAHRPVAIADFRNADGTPFRYMRARSEVMLQASINTKMAVEQRYCKCEFSSITVLVHSSSSPCKINNRLRCTQSLIDRVMFFFQFCPTESIGPAEPFATSN